ncbi:MAG: four helix bundle protein [Bacteroidota bacterium]|nr:four helix bundle protein [Bacteroidota bacterium]
MSSSLLKPFDILELSKKLVVACYSLTSSLPPEEITNLTLYIRNGALTVHINSVQATFAKKKKARKKFIKVSKNSLVIIDASIEALLEVGLVKEEATTEVMQLSSVCYQQLDRLKRYK